MALAGERYATNWQKWREIKSLDIPLVIMIGGATGVGKSTIATQLAVRLGIVRVVATDAIREVMRALFTSELMPTRYASSFEADATLREPPPPFVHAPAHRSAGRPVWRDRTRALG